MKRKIVQRSQPQTPPDWPDSVHPLLQRIYASRNIHSADELEKSLTRLLPYQSLRGIEPAVQLLAEALKKQDRIIVIGDFDADGATSTAVAVKALGMLGAKNVAYLVPNRFKFGYGLTPEIVMEASTLSPALIITVDNGISSLDGVKKAKQLGIKVLVTDHHLAGDTLPDADAIVNPNQPGDQFPSKNLAGVGVIFYVMLALRSYLRETHWFTVQQIAEPNMSQLLDLVALGTVADVVPLDSNNRILVNQGLKRIRAGQASTGIKALLEIANRTPERFTATDLGFAIGPRLNAAGRLEDMSLGIECLLSNTMADAKILANQLDQLNSERKEIEQDMRNEATKILAALHLDESDTLPIGFCLYQSNWHQGVIGILASRIKDQLHRPVIAFADGDSGEIKGSARSIPGVHIRDVLDSIACRHPQLLIKFGGHAMAAGLSLKQEDFQTFSAVFDEQIRNIITPEHLEQVIYSDGVLEPRYLSLQTATMLKQAEPWGQGFPEPMFDDYFDVVNHRVLGGKHLKLRLKHSDITTSFDAIAFNCMTNENDAPPVVEGQKAHVAYKLDVNEFRGQKSLQLMVEYIEAV